MAEIKISANTRQAEAALKRIEASLGNLSTQARRVDQNLSRFNNRLSRGSGGVSAFGASVSRIGPVLGALGGALATVGIGKFTGQIIEATRNFQNYTNQLRLITDGQEDLNRVMGLLTQAARDNRTAFGETVDLFTKLRISTENLGVSEERVLNVTGKLSQALQVAGADGNTAASVIRQFGQAMASGEVRGDEFRSLVEGLGPALAIMARESGITVGELRRMSQAGELTAERLFTMLENSTALSAAFQSMTPTISQLETAFGDAFDRMLVSLGEATGLTSAYTRTIEELTAKMDRLSGSNPFENLTSQQILEGVRSGVYSVDQAFQELRHRYDEVDSTIRLGILAWDLNPFDDEEAKADAARMLEDLRNLRTELEETAKAQEEARKAEEDRIKALDALKRPYQEILTLSEKYQTLDFRTPMEQALANQEEAQRVLNDLLRLQDEIAASGLNSDDFVDLTANIEAARAAVAGYGAEVAEITQRNEELAQREADRIAREAQRKAEQIQNEIDSILNKYTVTEAAQIASLQRQYDQDRAFAEQHITDLEERNALILEMDQWLAGEKAKIQEAITEKEKQETMKRIQEQLNAGNMILSAEQQRFLQKQGQEERAQQITNDRIEFEKKSELEKTQFAIEQAGNAFTALGRYNKTAFEAAKAFNIANAIMNTYMGATKALATYPPPFNFIAAAAVVASGMAQVASIRSQTYSGRALGGPVMGGETYMVGENGPELFTPNTTGSITRNSDIGGGAPVNVNFTIVANDTTGFDELLTSREDVIKGIISDAMEERGQRSMV